MLPNANMTLTKVIEILNTHQCDMSHTQVPDLIKACNIAIEATQRLLDSRELPDFDYCRPLLGETRD